MKKVFSYVPSLLVLAAAVAAMMWYTQTYMNVVWPAPISKIIEKINGKPKNTLPTLHTKSKATVAQDARVKILTAPSGAPSTTHRSAGGFVSDSRKLVLFPTVRASGRNEQFKQQVTRLITQNGLDDYYTVRFAEVPSVLPCTAPTPWVLQHCRSMCIIKGNQLAQVQGGISYQDVKEILQKYKNW